MPITRFHLTTGSLEDVRSAKPRLDLALASEPNIFKPIIK